MSDAKLRELERRWKETQSVEDEAAYLLERVRVGDLSRERLELAAYCGHEGAMKAAGIGPTKSPQDLAAAVLRVPDLRVAGLAACACASEALAGLSSILTTSRHGSAPVRAVESAFGWYSSLEKSALESCELTLVAPLSDLSPTEVHGHIVAALMLVVQSEGPFGHRVTSPPYKRGTSVDVTADLNWLIGTAVDLKSLDAIRRALCERVVPECLTQRD